MKMSSAAALMLVGLQMHVIAPSAQKQCFGTTSTARLMYNQLYSRMQFGANSTNCHQHQVVCACEVLTCFVYLPRLLRSNSANPFDSLRSAAVIGLLCRDRVNSAVQSVKIDEGTVDSLQQRIICELSALHSSVA